jgi:hypothetical protein
VRNAKKEETSKSLATLPNKDSAEEIKKKIAFFFQIKKKANIAPAF